MDLDTMAMNLLSIMEHMPRSAPQRMLHDLTKGEVFLLNLLSTEGGTARPGDMSRAMQTSTARIAAALGSMERKGWITREIDGGDHRRTLVHITPEGETVIGQAREALLQNLRQLLDELGEDDAREYLRLMTRVEEISSRIRAETPLPLR